MGMDSNSVKALVWLYRRGVKFGSVACLGRQGLHVDSQTLQRLLAGIGAPPAGEYSEELFKLLGASSVESFDASDYERATHVHDFNLAIPREFHERYDTVLDGGSLEHIFNVTAALANCMAMVKSGGYYIGFTPANNFFGHGFYQFSPEFYFRAFTPANAFAIEHVIAYEDRPGAAWFGVADPAEVRERTVLVNGRLTYLLVVARKLRSCTEFFSRAPQQSDYAAAWQEGEWKGQAVRSQRRSLLKRLILRLTPDRVQHMLQVDQGMRMTPYWFKRME